jgi:sodium-dependent dicarboxylate transporter 2/3/5
MSTVEREILGTLGVAIVFWVTGSSVEVVLGLPPSALSPAIIAIVAISYLSLRGIFHWEDVKGISWGFLFIIGGGLSLGETLNRTGVASWFGNLLEPVITTSPLLTAIVLLVFLSALLTNVINNATVVAIFVPVLISIAQRDPLFNAVQLVLPVTMATTFGYSLPSASGRMALISATGIVERREMMRCGLILTVISSLILAVYFSILIAMGLI